MCVGQYIDLDGLSHPNDLEIEDVDWVPQSPMNVLATPCIAEQNIRLYTVPRGNELYMPGFGTLGKFAMCTQEVDHDGNPVIVFYLGKGRPVMSTHPRVPIGSVLPAGTVAQRFGRNLLVVVLHLLSNPS